MNTWALTPQERNPCSRWRPEGPRVSKLNAIPSPSGHSVRLLTARLRKGVSPLPPTNVGKVAPWLGMPAQRPELETMDEDTMIKEVLDKFVNCHEQTYEEFLSTFIYLSKEDNVTQRGLFGTRSSEDIFNSVQFTHENEPNDHRLRSKAIFLRTSSRSSEEEQIALDEGQQAGSSFRGGLNWTGKARVNTFLEVENLDMDEEVKPQMSMDGLLLPGEVEDVSTHNPPGIPPADDILPAAAAQPLTPAFNPRPVAEGADTQKDETLGDEVQPFRLDEEFDYDTVMLTPKFTPAEIEAIREQLSKHKQENTISALEEPLD